ncbi:MAG: hypothetical protein ACK44W_03325 [Planctomycetota bacterium]
MRFAWWGLVVLASGTLQEDVVKKVAPDAERVRKVARKLAPGAREKIEKALGERLAEADLVAPLFECYATVPSVSSMEKTRLVVAVVSGRGPKGPFRLAVAVAPGEDTVHAVRVLENADEKVLESKAVLAQFQGFEYTANLYSPPQNLAAALGKAAGKDEAAREVDALVRMSLGMRAVGPVWDRLLEKIDRKEAAAGEDLVFLGRAFDESAKLVAEARFLKVPQQERFRQYAAGARADLEELGQFLKEGKFDEAYRKSGEIDSQRCARCHGAYRGRFREARSERGLGNGYFSTRLEVAVSDARHEASVEALARTVRKAVLLIEETK